MEKKIRGYILFPGYSPRKGQFWATGCHMKELHVLLKLFLGFKFHISFLAKVKLYFRVNKSIILNVQLFNITKVPKNIAVIRM